MRARNPEKEAECNDAVACNLDGRTVQKPHSVKVDNSISPLPPENLSSSPKEEGERANKLIKHFCQELGVRKSQRTDRLREGRDDCHRIRTNEEGNKAKMINAGLTDDEL